MIYIKRYNDKMNEGLLDMFKSLFKGAKKLYTNIKGGKKLEETLNKYKIEIDSLFDKLTKASLSKKAVDVNEGLNDDTEETKTDGVDNGVDNDTVDLDKSDLAQLINQIKKQIEVIKKRFYKEIDMFVKKNSTDKLEDLSFLTKNQFDDHVYSKYEEMFKNSNDKTSLAKVVKLRSTINKKMTDDIKKINADKSVGSTEKNDNNIKIKVGGNYIYNNSKGNKVYVNVISIDKDESGKKNDLLCEVVNKEGNEFFVLKNKLAIIKIGDKYKYTNKKGDTSDVEVTDVDDNGNVKKVKTEDGSEFDPIDSNLS